MLWWLVSVALAYELGDAHDIDPAVTLERGGISWTLQGGTLYPVTDEGHTVGFVFRGEGTFALTAGDDRQAKVMANRMVSLLGVSPEDARIAGRSGRMDLGVEEGVVLGFDAWEAVKDNARRVIREDSRGVYREEDDGTESVLVFAKRRWNRDRAKAERLLEDRVRWMDESGVDPRGLLIADRWEAEADLGQPSRWVASVRTDVDWGLYAGDVIQPRVPQKWLEVLIDDTGALEPGVASSVWAHGTEPGHRRLVVEHGPAPRGPQVDGMGVTTYFTRGEGGIGLEMGVTADVRVRGQGAPVGAVVLDLPHIEQEAWWAMPPLPHGFNLMDVRTLDGAELDVEGLSLGPQDEHRGDQRTFAVRLPQPLEPGQTLTLRVRFTDRVRYAHHKEWDTAEGRKIISFGSATGPVRVLPVLRSHVGEPAPVVLKAGVAHDMGKRARVVSAHHPTERFESDTGRWITVEGHTDAFPVSVGRWTDPIVTPGADDVPTITAHALHGISDLDRASSGIHDMIRLFQPMLPPFPHDHIQLAESFRSSRGAGADTAPGFVSVNEHQIMSTRVTLFGGMRSAMAMHRLWWWPHHVPPRDEMLPLATGMVYTLEGMGAVDGDDAVQEEWAKIRGRIDARVGWSQRSARSSELPSLAWALGPVLASHTGHRATLYGAVDLVLMGEHPASWDGLQAALGEANGEDWGGFLLTWVHSGTTPEVDVTWQQEYRTVRFDVTTDLPFGHFRLPVRVRRGREVLERTVDVVDGVGELELTVKRRGRVSVQVDPDRILPLRGLKVRQWSGRGKDAS